MNLKSSEQHREGTSYLPEPELMHLKDWSPQSYLVQSLTQVFLT